MYDFFKKNFFISTFACTFVLILSYFLLHPAYNWEHSENWFFLYSCLDKRELYDSRIPLFFDLCLDGETPRTRLLSWTSFVLNAELRKFLFDFVPFHASFSFTWIFSVLVYPVIFYKLLRTYLIDKEVAILGTILLISSVGWMSGHLMYFHQAKPMSSLFLILAWYFAKKYINNSKYNWVITLIFALILLIGTHWDELFFFSFAFIPLTLNFSKKNIPAFKSLIAAYLISLCIFFISTTYFIPYMTRIYNLQLYEFWKYAFSSNLGLSQLKFSDFIFNSSAMLASHIMPMVDVAELQSPTDIFYFVSGTLWLILFINIKDRKEFLKWTFVIIMFCLFQSLILSRRSGRLFLGSFYLGHLFSIFYSFIIALSLGTKQVSLKYKKIYKNITRGVLALLIFSAFHNSLLMNNDHMIQNRKGIKVIKNIKSYQTIWPPITNESTAPLSYSDILLIWNERDDFDAALALFNNIPEDGYWMYMHIYMRHNSKVRADGLIWGYPAQ